MSARSKTAALSFDDLDDDSATSASGASGDVAPGVAASVVSVGATLESRPQRAARTGVSAISETIEMHHKIEELHAKVTSYTEAGVIQRLDPKLVGDGSWRNRHALSFQTPEYLELKSEIEGAGGNVQPIKVRPLKRRTDAGAEYEVVYGRRRLRACLELNLAVRAIVQDMTDLDAFQEMERENRNREDLTAWEQGVMYKDALDRNLFSSQRQLAGALGLDSGNVSRAITLASLSPEVVGAFPSPLELQFRWASDLNDAFVRDPERVLAAARSLRDQSPRPSAKHVFARLLGLPESGGDGRKRSFSAGGKQVAVWSKDAKGAGYLKVAPGTLSVEKEEQLFGFLERLLSQ